MAATYARALVSDLDFRPKEPEADAALLDRLALQAVRRWSPIAAVTLTHDRAIQPALSRHGNPNGGAIALGHPLGMSGARITMTAVEQLHRTGGRYAIACMCVGVGQGVALLLERC